MGYKEIVRKIAELDWGKASPGDIVLLSRCTAKEFATSLRFASKVYQNDDRLSEMMAGELKTENMIFEDYAKTGDHWEFLEHFINKHDIRPSKPELETAMDEYNGFVESLADADRAMTVFSREEELTSIFEKIVSSDSVSVLCGSTAFSSSAYFCSFSGDFILISLIATGSSKRASSFSFFSNHCFNPAGVRRRIKTNEIIKRASKITKLAQMPRNLRRGRETK